MNRTGFAMIALLLAILLPLEVAHCMFMGLEAAPVAASNHGCCSGTERAPTSTDPGACPCFQLPPAAMSAPVVLPGSVQEICAAVIDDVTLAAAPSAVSHGTIEDSPHRTLLERPLEHHESRGPPPTA